MEAHLLALTVDALHSLEWTLRAVNVKRPGKPPKPLPRPGGRVQGKRQRIVEGLPVVDLRGASDGY